MKYFNKLIVFFLFILFGYGIETFGYTFTIVNMTGKDVKVRLKWAWGELTNKAHLIKPSSTSKLSFTGIEAFLCLTKIMVSIKKSGKWEKAREAKMGIVKSEDRFQDLKKDGLLGKVVAEGLKFLGLSMCQSRYFVLVYDWMSGKIYAITTIDL